MTVTHRNFDFREPAAVKLRRNKVKTHFSSRQYSCVDVIKRILQKLCRLLTTSYAIVFNLYVVSMKSLAECSIGITDAHNMMPYKN